MCPYKLYVSLYGSLATHIRCFQHPNSQSRTKPDEFTFENLNPILVTFSLLQAGEGNNRHKKDHLITIKIKILSVFEIYFLNLLADPVHYHGTEYFLALYQRPNHGRGVLWVTNLIFLDFYHNENEMRQDLYNIA